MPRSMTRLGVVLLLSLTITPSIAAFTTVRNNLPLGITHDRRKSGHNNNNKTPPLFTRPTPKPTTHLYSTPSPPEDPIALLPLLEAQLLSETDATRRSALLTSISDARSSAELGVRSAQFRFYEAFATQDLRAMEAVWSSAEDVRCVHPGTEGIDGKYAVMESWGMVFGGGGFRIEPSRTRVDVVGGSVALCSCLEETEGGGVLECLNVYRREEGSWKMILHMVSPIAVRRSKPPPS